MDSLGQIRFCAAGMIHTSFSFSLIVSPDEASRDPLPAEPPKLPELYHRPTSPSLSADAMVGLPAFIRRGEECVAEVCLLPGHVTQSSCLHSLENTRKPGKGVGGVRRRAQIGGRG